jgi:hypothetical protein
MTKNSNLGLYAVAAAILIVGVVAFDVPLGSLATFGLILVCPLMMIFMMRGMGGGGHGTPDDRSTDEPTDRPTDTPTDRDPRGTPR